MKIENLKNNVANTIVNLNDDIKINVKSYISIEAKMEIINSILNMIYKEKFIDYAKLDIIFSIFLVSSYTDIEINTENPEDLIEIFDYLEYNGYIDKILKAIPKKERDVFNKYFNDSLTELINHKNSIAGAIEVLADMLPTIMENLNEIKDDLADTDLTLVKDIYNKLENK